MFGFIDLVVLITLILLFRRSAKRYGQNKFLWMLLGVLSFIIGYGVLFLITVYLPDEGMGIDRSLYLITYAVLIPVIELGIGLLILQVLKSRNKLQSD